MNSEDKKVEVTKLAAFIPLRTYLKHFGTPNIIFHKDNFNYPYTFKEKLSDKCCLLTHYVDEFKVFFIDECFVKDNMVRFKEIENYTHYQTELEFKD